MSKISSRINQETTVNWWQTKPSAALFMFSLLLPVTGWAADAPKSGTPHQWPPAAAIAACKDKTAGDAVEITNRQGKTVAATCREDKNNQLVAIPNDRGLLARMTKKLGLTGDQQQQIKTILDAERATGKPLREQLAVIRGQIETAVKTEPFDEAGVHTLATSQGEIRAELTVAQARTRNQIYFLLTPAQRDLADKWLSAAAQGRRGHFPAPEAD